MTRQQRKKHSLERDDALSPMNLVTLLTLRVLFIYYNLYDYTIMACEGPRTFWMRRSNWFVALILHATTLSSITSVSGAHLAYAAKIGIAINNSVKYF